MMIALSAFVLPMLPSLPVLGLLAAPPGEVPALARLPLMLSGGGA